MTLRTLNEADRQDSGAGTNGASTDGGRPKILRAGRHHCEFQPTGARQAPTRSRALEKLMTW